MRKSTGSSHTSVTEYLFIIKVSLTQIFKVYSVMYIFISKLHIYSSFSWNKILLQIKNHVKNQTSILFSILINQPSKLYFTAIFTSFCTVFVTVSSFLRNSLQTLAPPCHSVINVPEHYAEKDYVKKE